MKKNIKFIIFFLLLISVHSAYSQFYNGHQMTFGKSRVQYNDFIWKFYRHDKFDTYFYTGGKNLSDQVAAIAEEQIPKLEQFFGYHLKDRLIFLCYNKQSDFRQSNVGYDSSNEQTNIGGVTKIIGNKVFIYSEGDAENLKKQVIRGLAEIMINEILYGGTYRQKVTNSALINLPEWFESGLVSFVSENWSVEIENRVKDGFESGQYDRINQLTGEEAVIAGHSIWNYIAETNGKEVIPNILYLTKVNKNADSGFMYILGTNIKQITPVWKSFYMDRFEKENERLESADPDQKTVKTKPEIVYSQVKSDKYGNTIAYCSNQSGKIKIYIYDLTTQKQTVIYKSGHRLDRIPDYTYPLLVWHPSGKSLSFLLESEGKIKLMNYNIANMELSERNMQYFDKILSFSYSSDGFEMLISGVKNGYTDIYIFNPAAGTHINITNDNADDFSPYFTDQNSKIVFTSNRSSDTLSPGNFELKTLKTTDVFLFEKNGTHTQILQRLTNQKYTNQTNPVPVSKNKFMYLSEESGIKARNITEYDSTIAFIDTSIHYRYFTKNYPVSNYPENIYEFDLSPGNKVYDIIFNEKKYNIYSSDFDINKTNSSNNTNKTEFIQKLTSQRQLEDSLEVIRIKEEIKKKILVDSLKQNPPKDIIHPDSLKFNINNYTFEQDSHLLYYDIYPISDSLSFTKDTLPPQQRNYLTNFYTDYLMQQVDLGFLNSSYQAFTGSAFYFNPGMNIFMKVGVFDLFEDYRITGGVRVGGNTDSYEYMFSFEDLKTRLDKQYIYHRQTFVNEYTDNLGYPFYAKVFTNELMSVLKYPVNEVASFRLTSTLRHDKSETLSTEYLTLLAKSSYKLFGGLKGEFIFDNTFSKGINLYEGTRFKVFGEFYQEIDQKYTNLFVVGGDFRYYKKIHRSLIFAGRFAASSSFGKSKLIYYLGGVDNWYTFSPEKNMFDKSVNINQKEDYVYQAVATNMRGFIQNARNGTNFAVINAELRFPIVKYFANRPLNSDFLNNFQIVAFTDFGSAWSGLTPSSDKNAYTTETIREGAITVVIDKNRAPVIMGYGLGLRSRLLGYFFRLDWAYGVERDVILPRIFYFSLNLDF